jgi:predicted acetylornithine/succinylornithine family transaminase
MSPAQRTGTVAAERAAPAPAPAVATASGDSALMQTYAPPPVTFVRGAGAVLEDVDGKRYLDFLSGLAVTSLGHSHPSVADAIARQASRLVHVSNLFGNEHAAPLAQAIDRLIGDGEAAGGKVFFANSGAEANECAIKLVRRYHSRVADRGDGVPGRHVIVSADGSFHGRTLATLHATGQPEKHRGFEPLPAGFVHVAFGDLESLAAVADAADVGAVLLEPIQGEGGVVPAPAGYLRAVRDLCDERGILLVLDEIQTGLARTGRWFGFHHAEVQPDVVTIAKALGNGVPIGACWATAAVAEAFRPGDHGSTFGGQPLAAAAARAVLEVMQAIDAPRLATRAGNRLRSGLEALAEVESVRGAGLLLGAVLRPGMDAKTVVSRALELGLVVNSPVAGVVRLAPPLNVADAEIDQAVSILQLVLAEQP